VVIIPVLIKVDFGDLHGVRRHWRGIGVKLFVNWAVKPISMALLGWLFVRHLLAHQLDSRVAGLILLAAAHCTAMVFLWSRPTNADPLFTPSQVALNDTIMVLAFAPIVELLLGLSSGAVVGVQIEVPVMLLVVRVVNRFRGWY
jgi:ACR3 family arsenite transporter